LAYGSPYENLRLGAVATCLVTEGYSVRLVDSALERLSHSSCVEIATQARSVVVVDLLFRNIVKALDLCRSVRASRGSAVHIIAIGEAAESCAEAILATGSVDAIPRGDPEQVVLAAMLRSHPGPAGTHRPDPRPRAAITAQQLASPPLRPHLAAALRHRPVLDVSSSRGCSYRCSFCIIGAAAEHNRRGISPPWRPRPAVAVVDEILRLHRTTGVDRVQFVDDNYLAGGLQGRDRALRIAALLRRAGCPVSYSIYARADSLDDALIAELSSSGLRQVYLGLESGSLAVLERLGKRLDPQVALHATGTLHGHGVRVVASFIVFEPRQDLVELDQTLEFMQDAGVVSGFSGGSLIPLPGTRTHAELLAGDLLTGSDQVWGVESQPRFTDERLGTAAALIQQLESTLDDRGEVFSSLVMAYHRLNDHLDCVSAGPGQDRLDQAHTRMRAAEVALLRGWIAAGAREPHPDTSSDWADAVIDEVGHWR
jgi:hypothetical protein